MTTSILSYTTQDDRGGFCHFGRNLPRREFHTCGVRSRVSAVASDVLCTRLLRAQSGAADEWGDTFLTGWFRRFQVPGVKIPARELQKLPAGTAQLGNTRAAPSGRSLRSTSTNRRLLLFDAMVADAGCLPFVGAAAADGVGVLSGRRWRRRRRRQGWRRRRRRRLAAAKAEKILRATR